MKGVLLTCRPIGALAELRKTAKAMASGQVDPSYVISGT